MKDLYLDHVLIAVHSLRKASDRYGGRLGFNLAPEGDHPGRGTHNRNIVFEKDYVELIAIHTPAEREGSPLKDFLERRDGLYAFAIGTNDIAGAVRELRAQGLEAEEPRPGSLARAPGKNAYTWRSAYLSAEATPGATVLLVQHDFSLKQRYESFPGLNEHANGAIGIHHLTFAVSDAEACARRWMRHFGLERLPKEGEGGQKTSAVSLRLGSAFLEFVSATDSKEAAAHIAAFGEGAMELGLKVTDLKDLSKTANYLSREGMTVEKFIENGKAGIAVGPDEACGARLAFMES